MFPLCLLAITQEVDCKTSFLLAWALLNRSMVTFLSRFTTRHQTCSIRTQDIPDHICTAAACLTTQSSSFDFSTPCSCLCQESTHDTQQPTRPLPFPVDTGTGVRHRGEVR